MKVYSKYLKKSIIREQIVSANFVSSFRSRIFIKAFSLGYLPVMIADILNR